jgi:hypothetical protein
MSLVLGRARAIVEKVKDLGSLSYSIGLELSTD